MNTNSIGDSSDLGISIASLLKKQFEEKTEINKSNFALFVTGSFTSENGLINQVGSIHEKAFAIESYLKKFPEKIKQCIIILAEKQKNSWREMLEENKELKIFEYIQDIKTIFINQLPNDFQCITNYINNNNNLTIYEDEAQEVYSININNIALLQKNILNKKYIKYISIENKKSNEAIQIEEDIISSIGNYHYIDLFDHNHSLILQYGVKKDINFYYKILKCKYFSMARFIDLYNETGTLNRINNLIKKEKELNSLGKNIKNLEDAYKIKPELAIYAKIEDSIKKIKNKIMDYDKRLLLNFWGQYNNYYDSHFIISEESEVD